MLVVSCCSKKSPGNPVHSAVNNRMECFCHSLAKMTNNKHTGNNSPGNLGKNSCGNFTGTRNLSNGRSFDNSDAIRLVSKKKDTKRRLEIT